VGSFILAVVMFGIVGLVLFMAVRSVRIQQEGQIGLVTAWGRFQRVLTPGRYILWPWEQVVAELPLQLFEWETPSQKLMLRGGTPLTLSAVIYYQIEHAHRTPGAPRPPRIIGTTPAPVGSVVPTPPMRALPAGAGTALASRAGLGVDSLEPSALSRAARRASAPTTPRPTLGGAQFLNRVLGRTTESLDITQAAYRAKYVVQDWQEATRKEALAVLQNVFSRISVAEDINGDLNWHETLGRRVRDALNEKTQRWGVEIIEVSFKDPVLSEMTLANLHSEARMEREGRVRAKEAESYQRVAEILHLTPADLLRWRQVEIMRELSKSPQPRVMFTTDMMGRGPDLAAPAQQPLVQAADAAPPAPQPDLRGYLGSEPPTPPVPPPGQRTAGSAPPAGSDRGMIAPGIQNLDQQ
jgi:regulator of protease activity HflC (stomatin/prohibitin superfamily)